MKTTQRLLEMRQRESAYILLVQMSPKALKMQENGDVNMYHTSIIISFKTQRLYP